MPEPEVEKPTEADKFLGLTSIYKQWANLGMAGIVAGIAVYLITFTLPSIQDKFHSELKSERDVARQEQQKSREHGQQAVKELADAIKYQTTVLDENQRAVRKNQEKLIEIQEKLLKNQK